MPIFQDYYILISRTDTGRREQVIMTYITEEEEQKLDERLLATPAIALKSCESRRICTEKL